MVTKKPSQSKSRAMGPVSPNSALAKFRKDHKKIPGWAYSARAPSAQVIHRTNRAPLGRPPTDKDAREKYNYAKARLTPRGTAKAEKHAINVEVRNRKAMADYEDYRLGKAGYDTASFLDADLEDSGYSDYDKNWKRKGTKAKLKAWEAMQRRNMRDY